MVKYKVIKVKKWMMPFGYGLTLFKLVFIREDSDDYNYVLKHEECHVRQWAENGFFKFIYLYLKELFKNGYKDNKYEVEARQYGHDHKDEV